MAAAGRQTIRAFGAATARVRPDPDFLLIGGKRAGSTSLFFDILGSPQVCPLFPSPDRLPKAVATKGIHYFDTNYFRGRRWYRSHLPSALVRERLARRNGGAPTVTGEGSPYYLFHPAAPGRAAEDVPGAKVVVILRDPVERAFSHWKERRRAGAEDLSFADALAAEADRLGDLVDTDFADPHFYSYAHEQQSYAQQGEYVTGVQRWIEEYGRDRVLVLLAEDYFREPARTLDEVAGFLGILPFHPAGGSALNATERSSVDARSASRLAARFAPHNERLRLIAGVEPEWT